MKKAINLALLLAILLLGNEIFAQQRIGINNNAYIVIDNSAYLVIDNPNTNALFTSGAGGNVVSESETDVVKWNIGNNISSYQVPFTTRPVSQGGNGTKIPLSVNITSGGSNDGAIIFSTYETSTDMNSPWASDVTTMFSAAVGGDGSLYVVDRFWRIDAYSYTTKPDVTMAFTYDDAGNEIAGTNTIIEANLQAQYYSPVSSGWRGLAGTANVGTNVVSPVTVPGTSFYKTWTLVDNTGPLPVELLDFRARKKGEDVLVEWVVADETGVDRYEVERSFDGNDFEWIGQVEQGNDYAFFDMEPQNGRNYYRLRVVEENGATYYSEVRSVDFSIETEIRLYPNPTKAHAILEITGDYGKLDLEIWSIEGKMIDRSSWAAQSMIELEMIEGLAQGMYLIKVWVDRAEPVILKLVKN